MATEPETLIRLLQRAAEQRGDRPLYRFLVTGEVEGPHETLSAPALFADACAVGAALRDMLPPADGTPRYVVVACWSPIEFARAFFGCLAAGAIPVPSYPPPLRAVAAGLQTIQSVIRDSGASVMIGDEATVDAILRVAPSFAAATGCRLFSARELKIKGEGADLQPHQPRETDTAFLQYTSGSTLDPRGAAITHRNILTNLQMIAAAVGPPRGAVGVTWLPLSHDLGLIGNFLLTLYLDDGELVIMTPLAFIERPVRWLQAISHFRAWATSAPNFAFALCSRVVRKSQAEALDLSCLQSVLCGAEPIEPATLDRFSFRFAPQGFRRDSIRPCYGLAEATLFVSLAPPRGLRVRTFDPDDLAKGVMREIGEDELRRQIVSCGVVQPMVDAAIVSTETHEPLPDAHVGEIWLSGPSIANGYHGWSEERNAAVFRARLGDREYLRTGDLGAIVDGQLYVTGRCKELVIVRGRNYDANDLQRIAATAHPDVRPGHVAVFADLNAGERVVVLAEVPRGQSDADYRSITRRIRARLGESVSLRPDVVVLVPPKSVALTATGKLRLDKTRQLWKDGQLELLFVDEVSVEADVTEEPIEHAHDPASGATTERVLLREIRIAARLGEQEQLPMDAHLSELGVDSLGLVQVVTTMSEWLDREISLSLVTDDPTLGVLLGRLDNLEQFEEQREEPAAEVEIAAAPPLAEPIKLPIKRESPAPVPRGDVPELSILFFASADRQEDVDRYRFVREAATLADRKGYTAVWVPERHFHPFGGLFPSPSVLSAALAGATSRIRLRAGSVVLPLHDPIRVAEEWAMVDNLSGGRVDVALATGWDADSFVLAPDHYQSRKEIVFSHARELRELWEGGAVKRRNGIGAEAEVRTYPRPLQPSLNVWITATHRPDLFVQAGREGFNVLTALLHQDVSTLAENVAQYRAARAAAGLDPDQGRVSVMLHTYVAETDDEARKAVVEPLSDYLKSSIDLWKRESEDLRRLPPEKVAEVALRRYIDRSSLIGDARTATAMLLRLRSIGVDEVACLIDFGIAQDLALDSILRLSEAAAAARAPKMEMPAPSAIADPAPPSAPVNELPELDPNLRHTLKEAAFDDVFEPAKQFHIVEMLRRADMMPFYLPFSHWEGTHARLGQRRILILSALDYLGLATHERVTAAAARAAQVDGTGRSGSRVHSGTTPEILEMEEKLAHFVGREDAVICTTGYQAMAGVVTTFMNNRTTLVVDEAVHASIIDGAAIARCRIQRFRHNDHRELDGILAQSKSVMVMVEGLYSNDGDISRLPEIAAVCKRRGVRLSLDDAHGLGVLGATGRGTEEHYACLGASDLIAGTFSKSLASIGGWIAADRDIIEYVRYHGRTVLFTAAIAPPTLAAASAALDVLIEQPELVQAVGRNADQVRFDLRQRLVPVTGHHGPVIRIPIGDDRDCVRISAELLHRGIFVHTVLYPSVPRDQAMIRLCISASHDSGDLRWATDEFAEVYHSVVRVRQGQEEMQLGARQ